MKESRFNIYYTADDGARLAFNSLTCALAVIDNTYDNLISSLRTLRKDNIPEELKDCYNAAYSGHFIVEDEVDELKELSIKRNFTKYNIESLGLTIAPTLACNFKCIYCYETSKPGIMSEKTQSDLIAFVRNHIKTIKSLEVSWYGGEPLLSKEIIYSLSEKLLDLCSQNNVEYNAYIISNGSLLDDLTISKLEEFKVKGIQITLDGPPEIHNSRRICRSGEGSFDIIIEHINRVLQLSNIQVSIRINLDRTNSNRLKDLLKILSERLISKDVKISFGQVTASTDACKSIESSCYNNKEFAKEILNYYSLLTEYGFDKYNKFPYPQLMLNYCCAELINSFVIDHEGYMYKCWNEIGNHESSVGNISDTSYDLTNYRNAKWVERNPISYDDCKNCALLPVCMGGCPHNDISLKNNHKCDMIKYNNRDIMLNYYKVLNSRE